MLAYSQGLLRDAITRNGAAGRLLLTRNQEFLLVKFKSSLRIFYGRHHDLVDRYGIYVSQMTT
jgi:hypothetical protein